MKYKILSVILIIFVVGFLYFQFKKHYTVSTIDNIEQYKKLEDSLNIEIARMNTIIGQQNDKIIEYEEKIKSADSGIVKNNVKIKEIHDKYEIQVHAIDSYNVIQLQNFLTGRYTDSNIIKSYIY